MLKTIRMRDVATFDKEGIVIDDLKKINIIYGGNGSGKTTISNYLSNPEEAPFHECELEWAEGSQENILVYNKAFREANFKNGDIAGVFTLGKATKDVLEAIELKKEEQRAIQATRISLETAMQRCREEIDKNETDLRDWIWSNLYRPHLALAPVFEGLKRKENFYNKILLEMKSYKAENIKDYEDIKARCAKLYSEADLSVLPLIKTDISWREIDDICNDKIWSTSVVGKSDVPIAKLIQTLENSDWVLEGTRLLSDGSDVCPFCQQKTVTSKLRQQFADFFDEEFSNNVEKMKRCHKSYLEKTALLLNNLTLIIQDSAIPAEYLDKRLLNSLYNNLKDCIEKNQRLICSKLKEPGLKLTLEPIKSVIEEILAEFSNANIKIQRNNDLVNHLDDERANLHSDVWRYLVSISIDKIKKYLADNQKKIKELEGLQKKLFVNTKSLRKVGNDLMTLEASVTSVLPTINEINRQLLLFGFSNFKIVESPILKNFYQIQRPDGSLANETLSEGEATFITFLYFMQLAKGAQEESGVNTDRILVIDDPISSLDSNVLFVVSTMVKEMMKRVRSCKHPGSTNIKQIILLTHNVYFHKEVSFIDGRDSNQNSFWVLRKYDGTSSIEAFGSENPIKSSYELLWQELRKNRDRLGYVSVQNLMRRILENYFTVFGNFSHLDRLLQQPGFDDPEEREIARTLLVWSNDGSHSISDDISLELSDSAIEVYYNVFKKIFVNTNNEGHYNMMMRISNDEADNVESVKQ